MVPTGNFPEGTSGPRPVFHLPIGDLPTAFSLTLRKSTVNGKPVWIPQSTNICLSESQLQEGVCFQRGFKVGAVNGVPLAGTTLQGRKALLENADVAAIQLVTEKELFSQNWDEGEIREQRVPEGLGEGDKWEEMQKGWEEQRRVSDRMLDRKLVDIIKKLKGQVTDKERRLGEQAEEIRRLQGVIEAHENAN